MTNGMTAVKSNLLPFPLNVEWLGIVCRASTDQICHYMLSRWVGFFLRFSLRMEMCKQKNPTLLAIDPDSISWASSLHNTVQNNSWMRISKWVSVD